MTIQQILQSATSVTTNVENFDAIEGQKVFELEDSPANIDLTINRVPQIPIVDYTLNNNQITVIKAQKANAKVQIRKFY